MVVLTAEILAETHPYLPDDWRMSMAGVKNLGGPWRCPARSCAGPSYLKYRCSRCGFDLAGSGSTAGDDAGRRG